MSRPITVSQVLLALCVLGPNVEAQSAVQAPASPTSIELTQGWEMQSSCAVKATGDVVSKIAFPTAGWHKTTVPNTVVGTLVDDKTYPDPSFGTNMKSLPGMNYSSATFFANQDMPDDSPFKCSWWWRNEFVVPAAFGIRERDEFLLRKK